MLNLRGFLYSLGHMTRAAYSKGQHHHLIIDAVQICSISISQTERQTVRPLEMILPLHTQNSNLHC